jgi:hypothetical protein
MENYVFAYLGPDGTYKVSGIKVPQGKKCSEIRPDIDFAGVPIRCTHGQLIKVKHPVYNHTGVVITVVRPPEIEVTDEPTGRPHFGSSDEFKSFKFFMDYNPLPSEFLILQWKFNRLEMFADQLQSEKKTLLRAYEYLSNSNTVLTSKIKTLEDQVKALTQV